MYLQKSAEINLYKEGLVSGHTEHTIDGKEAGKVKNIIATIFLYSICSGAIRKWAIDSNVLNNIIIGIQICIPFTFFLLRAKKKYYFNPILTIYTLVLLALALNPMNLTIFHGIFGFMLHFGFWFAMFFYTRYKKFFDFRKVITLFIVFALIEIVLGVIQYTLPTTHFLNRYVDPETIKSIATVGDAVRITGTFSYLGGFSAFLIFYSFLIWTLVRLNYPVAFVIILYALGLLGCFMSGARSSLYLYIIISMLMVFSEFNVRKIVRLGMGLTILFIVSAASLYFLSNRLSGVQNVVTKSYANFEARRLSNKNSGEEQSRIVGPIADVIFFRGDHPILGVGLGSTYQGTNAVWGTSPYVTNFPDYLEEEPERILVEGGFVLLIFKIVLFISLFRVLHIPGLSKVILGIVVIIFLPLVFNVYNAIFLFLGLAMLDNAHKKVKEV